MLPGCKIQRSSWCLCCNCGWILSTLATVWNSYRWYHNHHCAYKWANWSMLFYLFFFLLFMYIVSQASSCIHFPLFIVINWSSISKQPAIGQSANYGNVLRTPAPQVVEVTGSESPSTFGLNSRSHRVRHDLSRARLRAIENSLKNGHDWVPPSSAHRKTWEEEVIPN